MAGDAFAAGSEPAVVNADSVGRNRAHFDEMFLRIAQSKTLEGIWRDVYEDDCPEGARPFSFVTTQELRSLADALGVKSGERFADIACGLGGPSLFAAGETGASVVGIDSSRIAIEFAASGARQRGFGATAAFIVADAAATGLRDASVDGAISIDALQLVADRRAVLAEVGRIVKPGGRFAFTTWLSRQPGTGPPFPIDYRPLLEAAGLSFQWCHEPHDWHRREAAVFARIREDEERLRGELGPSVATRLVDEARKMAEIYQLIRRVNILAIRD